MSLSLKIAIRYLFSKKSHSAINIISMVSICGVAVTTMALICTLSVYNRVSRSYSLSIFLSRSANKSHTGHGKDSIAARPFDKISCRMARNRRNRSGNRRERLIDIPEPTNAGIIKRSTGQLFSSKQYR